MDFSGILVLQDRGRQPKNVHCSLFFYFTEGAVAGPQALHGAVSTVSVTLATVTFRGYWVRIYGVCMVSTARHSHCLIHQLLEGTYFLGIAPGWVLVHQILRSLGRRELGHTILGVSA